MATSGTAKNFSQKLALLWNRALGMNSATTKMTRVVINVCTANTNIGCAASVQSLTPKSPWLTSAPDSNPQKTKARLLPTSMVAMKSFVRADKWVRMRPRQLLCESSSSCRRLAETKAISIPEKKAEATRANPMIKNELEGSGSMGQG